MIPYPDPVVLRLLEALPATAPVNGRISPVLADVLPALRITKVGDAEPASTDEHAAPLYQIEVWAADEIEAGQLAWDIRNTWTSSKRRAIGDAVVYGTWIETNPRSLPDTDNHIVADTGTDYARYLFTVGVRLSGAST